jgi:hypothetical protein
MLLGKWGDMYDPCPINTEISSENDGLNLHNKWGKINFVNPPYSLEEKTQFVKRAVYEWRTYGNMSILLLPVSTSTKLFHHVIKPNATHIDFLEGRLKFEGINLKNQHVNPGVGINQIPNSEHLPKVNNAGTFDSMVVQIGYYKL